MDLGIAGRKAIVCASSRGLGRACAFRLAEAGCEVVVNGRDKGEDRRRQRPRSPKATGAKVIPGGGGCRDRGGSGRAVRRHERSPTSW